MSWKIDHAHSSVRFTVRHMMITNVHGEFKNFEGEIAFDEQDPTRTSVEIQIEAASIDTHEPQRDTHLRSGDFFNVEQYPQLTFKSTSVEVVDPQHARLHGDLTIRRVTKPVSLDVEHFGQGKTPYGKTVAGFNGWAKINRHDWKLDWNVALETGGFLVGDDIAINIELELVKEAVAEAEPAQD